MQRVADCKVGDWNAIGHKDGLLGEPANYAERKDFCDDHADKPAPPMPPRATPPAGHKGIGTCGTRWAARMASLDRWPSMNATPPAKRCASIRRRSIHRPTSAGWIAGNTEYWTATGQRDGASGQPLTQKEANRSKASAAQLRFDEQAYTNGWRAGNRTFWSDAGYNDARNGMPDSEFRNRAAARAGVEVQEDSYRARGMRKSSTTGVISARRTPPAARNSACAAARPRPKA
jgi:hypothetical protein